MRSKLRSKTVAYLVRRLKRELHLGDQHGSMTRFLLSGPLESQSSGLVRMDRPPFFPFPPVLRRAIGLGNGDKVGTEKPPSFVEARQALVACSMLFSFLALFLWKIRMTAFPSFGFPILKLCPVW